jgi:general secretion pathway protein G
MKRSLRQGGFTLLEIMLVVAIIAILVGSAIVMVGPALGTAQATTVQADIRSIKTELLMYQSANGSLPTTEQGLKALVEKPSTEPAPSGNWRQLATEIPQDPWHQDYHYECPGTHNPDGYDLYSIGPDHKPGTADDIGNWKAAK